MAWDVAIVFGNISIAFILLWLGVKFRKENIGEKNDPENEGEGKDWFNVIVSVLFIIIGLYVLMAAGSTTLAVIDVTNSTQGFANNQSLTATEYNLLEDGTLAIYKALYYGIRTFMLLFLVYMIYYAITLTNAFIEERRAKNRKRREFDGEEPM